MVASSHSVAGQTRSRLRLGARLFALGLGAVSLAYVVYGLRAEIAQSLYYRSKFGADREDLPRIAAHCEAARALYPYNYYFAMWIAEKAYYTWAAGHADTDLELARRWCDAGLALNVYRSQLRLLKTRLLRRESLARATAYWAAYVDWNFWNPHHHAILAELYAAGGQWGKAMQALRWVKGSPYYKDAQKTVNDLWRQQMKPPAKVQGVPVSAFCSPLSPLSLLTRRRDTGILAVQES